MIAWLKNLIGASWFKAILNVIWGILKDAFVTFGKNKIEKIKAKIVEASKLEISGEEKFKLVFDYVKSLVPTAKDSLIDTVIQSLVSYLKKTGVIS